MNVTIEKIEIAAFGKLKNVSLSPSAGINILSAPNETGKSTIAAFIKFVFYGFAGTRMQSISENERKLYTPWDSECAEGAVRINADGTEYVIYRKMSASGKETVDVVNRKTGKAEFIGAVPGEVFFGVGEAIFARTLFFRQLTTPQSRDELLADKLRDIAISADEQVSTKKAVSRLSEAKNELKGRAGNGLIPKAEKERERLETLITEGEATRRDVERLRAEVNKRSVTIAEARTRLELLSEERRNIEKYDALLQLRKIKRNTVEEKLAREEYERASAGLKRRADSDAFGELSQKNAELVAEQRTCKNIEALLTEAEDELEALEKERPFDMSDAKRASKVIESSEKISKICFIAAAVAAVLGLFVYVANSNIVGFLGIAAAVVLCAVGGVFLGRPVGIAKELGCGSVSELKSAILYLPTLEKQIKDVSERVETLGGSYDESRANCLELESELNTEIGKYADVSNENYAEQIEQILAASAESGEKLAVWRAQKNELDAILEGVDVEALAEEARDAKEPERERAQVDREIRFYKQQYDNLVRLNQSDELEIASLEAKSGDLASMVGKRDALDARLDDLLIKHDAYEAAIRLIEEASDYMKSQVAPRISERANEYFSAATGGKYNAFEIDTRLSMSFGEDFRKSCDYLSAGTRDSAYLSLRLALADMLFGGCGVPMILDDAFVRIDDMRLRMIAGAVKEASKKHQIFILTHGDREQRAFDDINAEYTDIEIRKIE